MQCYFEGIGAKWTIPWDIVEGEPAYVSEHFHDTMQGAPAPYWETGNKNEAAHCCASTSGFYNYRRLATNIEYRTLSGLLGIGHSTVSTSHWNLQHNSNTSLPLVCVLSHWWPSVRRHNKFWNRLGIATDSWCYWWDTHTNCSSTREYLWLELKRLLLCYHASSRWLSWADSWCIHLLTRKYTMPEFCLTVKEDCAQCHCIMCVLHNMCEIYGDRYADTWIEHGIGVQKAGCNHSAWTVLSG